MSLFRPTNSSESNLFTIRLSIGTDHQKVYLIQGLPLYQQIVL